MFIMLIIVLSSIALASEDPVDEDSPRNKFMGYADYFFTAIFTLECSLKILDLGFILHPGAYMRDFWNFMDITVVTCALISFYHTIALVLPIFETQNTQNLEPRSFCSLGARPLANG
jgi:Ion transport protein.